jgi:hypothetical protein
MESALCRTVAEHRYEEDVQMLRRYRALSTASSSLDEAVTHIHQMRVSPYQKFWNEVLVPATKHTLRQHSSASTQNVLGKLIEPFTVRCGVHPGDWQTPSPRDSFAEFVLKIPDAVLTMRYCVGIAASVLSPTKFAVRIRPILYVLWHSNSQDRVVEEAAAGWIAALDSGEFPVGIIRNILNCCNCDEEGHLLFKGETDVAGAITDLVYTRDVVEAVGECWLLLPSPCGGWALFNLLTFQDTRSSADSDDEG